jgi:hypothetical protein
MKSEFRPWGQMAWILPKLSLSSWSILGVLGTEERCTALLGALETANISFSRFLHILDPSPFPEADFDARYAERKTALLSAGADASEMPEVELLSDIDTIRDQFDAFKLKASENVILDVSAMPKWWFYPLIRFLVRDPDVKNLLVTYASAQKYEDKLSFNPEPLNPLPTFGGSSYKESYEELVVGVGYAPLGLRDLYGTNMKRVRYLFPFPPGPPHFERNWRFLKQIESDLEPRDPQDDDYAHVHMYDCSAIFDALRQFSDGGLRKTALAPFGPKTMSLAMCLFSLAAESAGKPRVPVFYTTGIKQINGEPDIHAYCLKLGGRELYTI